MKLASTTGDVKPIPTDDHLNRVRHVAKAGFKYIDLSFYSIDKDKSPFMSNGWRDYVEELKALADELAVQYVQAHLPNCNPLDEAKFDEYCRVTNRAIEVCGLLGISNAVIHAGWKGGVRKQAFFDMNAKALEPLSPTMEKYGVNVLVENSTRANMTDKYYFFTGADMKAFIDFLGHPLIHACWDIGHANIEGHQYEDILALGDDLRAVHVHDNKGRRDEHMAPFTGTVNMGEVITALIDSRYKGYFTLEADAVIYGKTWLSSRHIFERDTRLFDPTIEIYDAAERGLFETSKACLEAYGIFEE